MLALSAAQKLPLAAEDALMAPPAVTEALAVMPPLTALTGITRVTTRDSTIRPSL